LLFCVQANLLAFLHLPLIATIFLSYDRFGLGAPPLAPAIAKAIRKKMGAPVARHYGLTEASPTTHANLPGRIKENSVGIAVRDCEDRIMDLRNRED